MWRAGTLMWFRRMGAPWANRASRMAEAAWGKLIVLDERRILQPTQFWHSTGGQRVLVVAPHPDDEVIGCGGVALKHHAAGDDVAIVYVTDGRQSRAQHISSAEMAALRESEALQAASLLQARVTWMGLPEGEWQLNDGVTQLSAVIARECPNVIYTPSRVDFHPEHLKVAHIVALALLRCNALETSINIYAVQVPLTRLLTNLVANIGEVQTQVMQALAAHDSQKYTLEQALRQRRYATRAQGWPAEGFWCMPAALYCRLHKDAPNTWDVQHFYGMRRRAFWDGLAYAKGREARAKLLVIGSEAT
jgi:N-acetylglucosamine malate deacetylase 1